MQACFVIETTPGERLELVRRSAGLSQVVFADLLGVSPYRYRQLEHDEADGISLRISRPLTASEWCWLQRRRAGWSLREMEVRTGLKGKWVHRAERGLSKNVQALVTWWETHGYR